MVDISTQQTYYENQQLEGIGWFEYHTEVTPNY